MHSRHTAAYSRGFTLIELMVTVVIATILLSIAIPSYQAQVRQSRRIEAKSAVLELAAREERYLSTNPAAYTNNPANLGYQAFNVPVGSGYYSLNVPCTPACAPAGALANPSYTITAVPVAGAGQDKDSRCASYSVDSTGKQYASDSTGADNTVYCWGQ